MAISRLAVLLAGFVLLHPSPARSGDPAALAAEVARDHGVEAIAPGTPNHRDLFDRVRDLVAAGEGNRLDPERVGVASPAGIAERAIADSDAMGLDAAMARWSTAEGLAALRDAAPPQPRPPAATWQPEPGTIYVLVSTSMPRPRLEALFRAAVESGVAVAFVFRGLPEGMSLETFLQQSFALAPDRERVPGMLLDPRPFRAFDPPRVPTWLHEDEAGVRTTVVGDLDLGEFLWTIARRPGLVHEGAATWDVVERDLAEVMQERVAAIDWDRKRQEAVTRFWHRQRFVELVPAEVDRVRRLDLSFVVEAPIRDAAGRVLVAAGTEVDPFAVMPFDREVVVFDPLREEELAFARARRDAAGPLTILVATRFRREDGFRHVADLAGHLQGPVYLLTPEMRVRFALERTPSTLIGEAGLLRVEEHGLGRGGGS